jgi:ABC-type molybdenum transport system ATPase subunit/photorepair protein PhrA
MLVKYKKRALEGRGYLTNDDALGELNVQVGEPKLLQVVHHRDDVAIAFTKRLKLDTCGRTRCC